MKRLVLFLSAAGAFAAGDSNKDKGPAKGEGVDKFARIEAIAHLDKAAIAQAVGGPLEDGIVVIEVKVTPAEGRKLTINRDDFLLRSDRSGERSTPYSPSQIAGSTVLRVNERGVGSVVESRSGGPAWGGLGGGRPSTLPGMGPQGVGNGTATVTEASAAIDESASGKPENPMLAALKRKILAEKEISEPASGQLYFLMEGKQKVKDIELLYKTEAGRISVRFKQAQQ